MKQQKTRRKDRKSRQRTKVIHVTVGYRTTSKSATQSTQSSYKSSQSFASEQILSRKGMTDDYHRRKITKKHNKYRFLILLIVLVMISIIGIILAVLLIKSKQKIAPNFTPVLRWNKTGITILGTVNVLGNANNQVYYPHGLEFDYENNLYIADTYNHRIQKLLLGASAATTVAGEGIVGSTPQRFNLPTRLVVKTNGDFYVSDTYNSRVQYFRDGNMTGTTVAGITGFFGNSINELNAQYGISRDPISSMLYIADTHNHRIMSYASGSNTGALVFGGIAAGISNTQLLYPVEACFDRFSNSLLIVNRDASNVVRYELGASTWQIVAGSSSGAWGIAANLLRSPRDVTIDPMGNAYVTDKNNHRIQFFPVGQVNGTTIAGITGIIGANASTLNGSWAARLDSQLNLYVADTDNHRIQKFSRY